MKKALIKKAPIGLCVILLIALSSCGSREAPQGSANGLAAESDGKESVTQAPPGSPAAPVIDATAAAPPAPFDFSLEPFAPEEDFLVRIIDDGTAVEITGYAGTNTVLRIPPEIQGLPVTAIGDRAFLVEHWTSAGRWGEIFVEGRPEAYRLTNVCIPHSVTRIGDQAFTRNSLRSVSIPDGVTHIGEMAFARNGLTAVVIPEGITRIEDGAFRSNALTALVIPENVSHIGNSAFEWNPITAITFPESLRHIGDSAFASNRLESVVVPNSVSHIGSWAFSSNRLTSFSLPDTMTHIPDGLFTGNFFQHVSIPEHITHIGGWAFIGNQEHRLSSVTIPYGVTFIGVRAFSNNHLTGLSIPESVTHIDDQAFLFNQITEVVVPESVTRMGSAVFGARVAVFLPGVVPFGYFLVRPIDNGEAMEITGYTGSNRELLIPSHIQGLPVTSIADEALRSGEWVIGTHSNQFGGSPDVYSFTSVIIPDTVTRIGNRAFQGNRFTSLVIPEGVTHIGNEAFNTNWILYSVTIPYSVVHIGFGAFRNAPPLTSVTIPNSAAQIASSAFDAHVTIQRGEVPDTPDF